MLEILISSTVLILFLCGIRALLRGKINLHFQYALWLLVVIRLFPLALFINTDIPRVESPISIMNSYEYLTKILPVKDTEVDPNRNANSTKTDNTSVNEDDSNKQHTSLLTTAQIYKDEYVVHSKNIITTLWYIGMILSAIWFIYVNIRFQRTIKKDRRLLFNVECKLPVYVSNNIDTPMLLMVHGKFGIYVTPKCEENEVMLNHALTHELCHYKHLDYLWSFIRCTLLVIYWFNPFVWVAAMLSKRDCELSCDVAALNILGETERIAYGRTILEFVTMQKNFGHIFNVATGMLETRSGMKERITRILKKPKMMRATFLGILVILCTITIITFTTAPNQESYGKSSNKTLLYEDENSNTNEYPKVNENYNVDEIPRLDESNNVGEIPRLDESYNIGEIPRLDKNYNMNESPNMSEKYFNSDPSNEDLSKLLDGITSQEHANGYYSNGESFMTPDGPIESLSDFTNEMVINRYFGKSVWNEKNSLDDDGYSKSFHKLKGICYWLSITASKESSIDIDYTTTTSDTSLKTLLILPDGTVYELKSGESNVITIPQGTSEITIVAYDAAGSVTIKFNDLSESIKVNEF